MPEKTKQIFVFGSNLAGRHGKGAALHAAKKYGAVRGVGYGRTGMSYAIPTKDENLKILPLTAIRAWCFAFIEYAKAHPELQFTVTPVGTGLAGYSREQIAPFFTTMPLNCEYAKSWYEQEIEHVTAHRCRPDRHSIPDGQRMHRVRIDITLIEGSNVWGRIPSWNPHYTVRIPYAALPENSRLSVGSYLLGMVNIGAESASDLVFENLIVEP